MTWHDMILKNDLPTWHAKTWHEASLRKASFDVFCFFHDEIMLNFDNRILHGIPSTEVRKRKDLQRCSIMHCHVHLSTKKDEKYPRSNAAPKIMLWEESRSNFEDIQVKVRSR
eukprot:gnl/MRDRNA2_/MRDRNA2_13343_c0_seq1.p1 gnl/MRDRNA2_/MRDRNA2_13343_c0~~gnl/MRDRNA2_/MRDRNA2_13343_c0_seq1.p1  ORF type:complete len:113 (-),score=12.40 gnl/MRDRNA2_/MRDRNA2_13343_c0_seq1:19-357(-)